MSIYFKSIIKKSLVSFLGIAAVSSIFALSAGAKTDYITPSENGYRYPQASASYYDKSSSNYYHSIWTAAKNGWNNTGAFTWHESNNPNCRTFTSSVNCNDGQWNDTTGMTFLGYDRDNNGYYHGAHIYLNRYVLDEQPSYSKQSRIYVAEHEMGHAIGLDHNPGKSVMNPENEYYGIQECDIRGVNNIYRGYPFLTSMRDTSRGTLYIDYARNYSGNSGLSLLKSQAPIIVEGTITNSHYYNENADNDDNDYTVQTLNIIKSLKGHLHGSINFEQSGTNQINVNNSILLNKGQNVIVMLNKDNNGNYYVINNGQGIFTKSHLLGATRNGMDQFIRASDNSVHSSNEL